MFRRRVRRDGRAFAARASDPGSVARAGGAGYRFAFKRLEFRALAKKDPKPPAPDDHRLREQEQFFEEVAEELKQERYMLLWKKYGRYFVGLAVVVVLAVAAYQYWQTEQQKAQLAASEQYAKALELASESDPKKAITAFLALVQQGPPGYAALAQLQQAALLLKSGDRAGAIAAYTQLADKSAADPLFRDAAVIHWAFLTLDDADPAQMTARLKPIIAKGNPWRFLALELSAHYALRADRRADALQIWTDLEKDNDAPAGVRGRAREMLAILGKS
jgi:hypothetical protein